MARHRGFDTDDVVQKAMRVFWRQGYVAASMSDLYAATGLKPDSLYAAFKDKEGLFRTAFERYAESFRATLPKDASGMAAITAWLTLQADIATTDDERAGCLIVTPWPSATPIPLASRHWPRAGCRRSATSS
jgi:TetR/AcrR family transcriptional regulator, transcriptional repressor for nem operon